MQRLVGTGAVDHDKSQSVQQRLLLRLQRGRFCVVDEGSLLLCTRFKQLQLLKNTIESFG